MSVNKVVYGGSTLIDLTDTTVTADTLVKGITALNAAGDKVTGTVVIPNLQFVTSDETITVGTMTI